jgi:GT2 family glycosyltransferase
MISVVIPYYSNQTGLAVLLTMLQSQRVLPTEIIIIDTSGNGSGAMIVRRYTTHNTPVIVEEAQCSIYAAWNRGIALSDIHADILFLNDDVLIPHNFIGVLSASKQQVNAFCYVPATPPKNYAQPFVPHKFPWHSARTIKISATRWMPGFAFLLTKTCIASVGVFDEHFGLWYGDTDYERRIHITATQSGMPNPIIRIDSLFAYHYGRTSYEYTDTAIQAQIDRDTDYFKLKYART